MTTRTRIGQRWMMVGLLFAFGITASACGTILGFDDATLLDDSGVDAPSGADADSESSTTMDARGADAHDAANDANDATLDGSNTDSGVDSGPTLKQAFETVGTFNGRLDAPGVPGLGGLAAGDARCMDEAAMLFPNRTFVAWLSVTGTSAKSRLLGGGPWYVRNALFGTLTEMTSAGGPRHASLADGPDGGMLPSFPAVWTGTDVDGTPENENCSDWSSIAGDVGGEVGLNSTAFSGWTASTVRQCDGTYHLYCFEM